MCECTPVLKQFIAIFCCNLLTLSTGLVTGWATINFNDLQTENSTFPVGPLTLTESSLVVSMENFGGFVGNFAILPLNQIIGVKRMIHLLGIPLIISSLLIIWAQNVYYLYVSRILTGIATGAIVVGIPTLINDISHNNVRGALNSIFDPSYNIGVIISFTLGNYLKCVDQAKAQLIMPAIFIVIMFLFPESPEFWINKHKQNRAMKSRRFYKGSIPALEKVEFIEKGRNNQVENERPDDMTDEIESNSKLRLKDFFTPHAKKAFLISFVSLLMSFFSGAFVILSYVTDIFTKTGSALSEKNSSILISITQIIANIMLLNIVERINRKTLYIWSAMLTTASFFLFGVYCLLWLKQPEYEWLPPLCFACIIFFSCMGLIPIPYIIITEIFPKKIRQICLAIVASSMWLMFFIVGLIFPLFLETYGVFTCMMTLGMISLLNVFFGIYCIPETRGKSFETIVQMMTE